MEPEDRPRRRRRPFDDLFREDHIPPGFGLGDDIFYGGFGDEFKRMHEHINRIMRDALTGMGGIDPSELKPGKNYVYGFSMRTGPDGKPMMEEFGNVPRTTHGGEIPGEREPLVDVIDGKDEITVIAELPGVNKEEIDLNADEKSLTIKVDSDERKYYKDLSLPATVKPDSVKASYKNGILEVKLKRVAPQQEKPKKRIMVE